MKIFINNSPNFSRKMRSGKDIKFIIIHYTGMQSEIESIKRLKNPKSKVSCHYLINRKGNIIQMVHENKIAWHAGNSKWKNISNLNTTSLGIELVNKGEKFGYENFPNLQVKSLILLCKFFKTKYKIKKENFLGHSDIAPLRKIDPGYKFPWKTLSSFGFGQWYKFNRKYNIELDQKKFRNLFFKNLYKIGYRYFKLKQISKNDKKVISAFQQKYLPKKVNGKIDEKTLKISYFLANKK